MWAKSAPLSVGLRDRWHLSRVSEASPWASQRPGEKPSILSGAFLGNCGARGDAQAAVVLRIHRGVASRGVDKWGSCTIGRHPCAQRSGGGTQASQQGATSPTLRTDRRPTIGGEDRGPVGRVAGKSDCPQPFR